MRFSPSSPPKMSASAAISLPNAAARVSQWMISFVVNCFMSCLCRGRSASLASLEI